MSTRANIIIKDARTTLYFYRHSDGYPEYCGKDLEKFVNNYSDNTYRDNVQQSAGHLIVRGYQEHNAAKAQYGSSYNKSFAWKVGNYEPTDTLHCDVEYIYIIDLEHKTLETRCPIDGFWDKPSLKKTKSIKKVTF